MIKRIILLVFIISVFIGLSSCSDSPRKTTHYTVTSITKVYTDTTKIIEGYKHGFINKETGHPGYLFYPEITFQIGDELVMKRTRKEVSFTKL